MASTSDGVLLQWYRNRIAEPSTDDEVYGYWLFVFGVLIGLFGVLLAGSTAGQTGSSFPRLAGIALGGLGLLFLLIGPIIRLPLERRATRVSYIGGAISVLAIVWLVVTFEGGRSQRSIVFGTYAIGMAIIALGAILVPMLSEKQADSTDDAGNAAAAVADAQANADAAVADAQAEAESARQESATLRDDADELRDDVAGLSDELAALHDSQATFELYEDNAGEYRWRLEHTNGNIIADSGQGYSERREAEAAIERIRERVGPAQYLRADPTASEIYQDSAEEWRWRLIHKNGKILADGGEGYDSRSSARDAVDRVRTGLEDDTYDFDVFEDNAGKYRWRLEAENGQIVADSGQGFAEESGAQENIERVEGHSADAAVLDVGTAAFEIFEDRGGKYRWRLRHRNGNILSDSGQGYSSRTKAFDGVDSVKRNAPNAEATEA